jgi:hypothetical protein
MDLVAALPKERFGAVAQVQVVLGDEDSGLGGRVTGQGHVRASGAFVETEGKAFAL